MIAVWHNMIAVWHNIIAVFHNMLENCLDYIGGLYMRPSRLHMNFGGLYMKFNKNFFLSLLTYLFVSSNASLSNKDAFHSRVPRKKYENWVDHLYNFVKAFCLTMNIYREASSIRCCYVFTKKNIAKQDKLDNLIWKTRKLLNIHVFCPLS